MTKLRRAVIEELSNHIDQPPELAPHEFSLSDFKRQTGLNYSKARRELDRLVKEGIVAGGDDERDARYDPDSKRRVVAYWRVEDAGAADEPLS